MPRVLGPLVADPELLLGIVIAFTGFISAVVPARRRRIKLRVILFGECVAIGSICEGLRGLAQFSGLSGVLSVTSTVFSVAALVIILYPSPRLIRRSQSGS